MNTARRHRPEGRPGHPTELSAVLTAVLNTTATQHETLFTIQRDWKRLVGGTLAAHTKPVSLRRGRLVVHIGGPGEGFALTYERPRLLGRIKQLAGGEAVQEILLRPGDVAPPRHGARRSRQKK